MGLQRGTLAYMSPELFGAYSTASNGPVKAPVTQAVDVYSFGVLMWEVLSGEKPSRTTSLRKIRQGSPLALPLWPQAMWRNSADVAILITGRSAYLS